MRESEPKLRKKPNIPSVVTVVPAVVMVKVVEPALDVEVVAVVTEAAGIVIDP